MGLFDTSALTSGDISGGGVTSSLILTVSSLDDLPAPVAGVITSPANTLLLIIENIDLGTDRLVIGSGGSITGVRRNGGGASTISGTTTDPLITVTDSGDYLDIGFNQLGTGDIFNVAGTSVPLGTTMLFTRVDFSNNSFRVLDAFNVSFIACNFILGSGIVLDGASTVNLLAIKETSLFVDKADADVAILIESGANFSRLILNTVGFIRTFASKCIVVEDGATIASMELKDVGLNLFNPGATGIELANPDAIGMGTLDNTNANLAAIPIASKPVFDSVIDVSAEFGTPLIGSNMILDGNLWLVDQLGNSLHKFVGISNTLAFSLSTVVFDPDGITNDGVNVIHGNPTVDLIVVLIGETAVIDFQFAAPAGNLQELAFDGQDLWVVDRVTALVYQLDGKSTMIKNSWATADNVPVGIDVDGSVVMVLDGVTNNVSVHQMDGTLLYQFPSGSIALVDPLTKGGISHHQDQYVISNPNTLSVNIFDKNIPFHQGSKNWKFKDSNIPLSAARLIARVTSAAGTGIQPDMATLWTDIADAGVTLIWGAAAEGFEKFLVTDAINGTVKYTGVREMATNVSANLLFAHQGSSVDLEFGIFLNNEVISASVLSLTVDTNNSISLTFPNFTLRLKQDDELRLRFRNNTSVSSTDFFSGILSV